MEVYWSTEEAESKVHNAVPNYVRVVLVHRGVGVPIFYFLTVPQSSAI